MTASRTKPLFAATAPMSAAVILCGGYLKREILTTHQELDWPPIGSADTFLACWACYISLGDY